MFTCGICGRSFKEGQTNIGLARLAPGDKANTKPGLYHACTDCVEAQRAVVATRLGKQPAEVTDEDLT